MNSQTHACRAHGCCSQIPPELLLCGRHWKMVPKELKRALWKLSRPGSDATKRTSDRYLTAAANAINAVAEIEQGRVTS
ncbi:MAG: hypothetical protein ACOY5W_08995 [Pseudomonadota bacterium]